MKILYTLLIMLTVIGILPGQQPSNTPKQNTSLDSEDKKVCVIYNVVKPSAVWFKQSITLTQSIKEAGGVPSNSKSTEVYISRRLEGAERMIIGVNLKAIEKGRAQDVPLEDNDLVEVMAKDKKKRVPVNQSTQSACAACGCRIMQGMHGSLIY
jgi:sulfur carrier protein ThiS